MNSLKRVIVVNIVVVVALGIALFLPENSFSLIEEIKKIDQNISGEIFWDEIDFSEDKTFHLIDHKSKKNNQVLKEKTIEFYFYLFEGADGGKYYDNQLYFDDSLDLMMDISEETEVEFAYNQSKRALTLYLPSFKLKINNQIIETPRIAIMTKKNIPPNSILQFGENLYDVAGINGERILFGKLIGRKMKNFQLSEKNLIDSRVAGFEKGLWQDQVGDCSDKMNGEAKIGMELLGEEEKVLKLFSKNHYACTNKTFVIDFSDDRVYKFQFNYQNLTGGEIRYYYRLRSVKNNKKYAFAETIGVEDNNWHLFSTIINPKKLANNILKPEYSEEEEGGTTFTHWKKEGKEKKNYLKDVDLLDVYFYAPSDGEKEVVNLYDNLKLSEYKIEREEPVTFSVKIGDKVKLTEGIRLKKGKNIFEYINKGRNLLPKNEGSFENGFWQKKVRDCSNFKAGLSKIKMEKSDDATEGRSSLKLSSENHYACTNKNFPIKLTAGKTYKLIFDYKNIEGGEVMVNWNLYNRIDSESGTEKIKVKDSNWHTHKIIIKPKSYNAENINIHFYAPSDGRKVVNLYDNLRLIEWAPANLNSYYLHAEREVDQEKSLKSIEYKNINSRKSRVILHGVKRSFLLAYPEKYSKKWRVYLTENRIKKIQSKEMNKALLNYEMQAEEVGRQATREELEEFIENDLISAVGSEFIGKNYLGSIRNNNLKNGWGWETFFKKTISEKNHFQLNGYSNAWWVDLNELCQSESRKANCQINGDGSYDLELIIEHRYNNYLSFSFLISVIFLAILLILDFVRYQKIKSGGWREV